MSDAVSKQTLIDVEGGGGTAVKLYLALQQQLEQAEAEAQRAFDLKRTVEGQRDYFKEQARQAEARIKDLEQLVDIRFQDGKRLGILETDAALVKAGARAVAYRDALKEILVGLNKCLDDKRIDGNGTIECLYGMMHEWEHLADDPDDYLRSKPQ